MNKREYAQANKDWLFTKAQEEGVKPLPKGIYYKVLAEGKADGKHPTPRSIVSAHYTGRTIDGKQFDSSRGGAPLAINHRMDGVTTYPFYVIGGDWGSAIAPVKDELPLKGDTVVGNDVWIGQHVTIMPGVHIGDGAIIGANSVVASDIPPYAVAVGNPCRVVRMRFDDEFIAFLLQLKWWDWDIEKIERNFKALSSGDLSLIRNL